MIFGSPDTDNETDGFTSGPENQSGTRKLPQVLSETREQEGFSISHIKPLQSVSPGTVVLIAFLHDGLSIRISENLFS